jgi:hypothetical protein
MSDHGAKLLKSILPIPDRAHIGLTTHDAKDPNTKFPSIEPLRPPLGAPNMLVVLLNDVGFAASSAFGGPCQRPNFEKLVLALLPVARPVVDRYGLSLGIVCQQVSVQPGA